MTGLQTRFPRGHTLAIMPWGSPLIKGYRLTTRIHKIDLKTSFKLELQKYGTVYKKKKFKKKKSLTVTAKISMF